MQAWIEYPATLDLETGKPVRYALDADLYSCPDADDGLHDWGGFDRTLCYCIPGGTMHTYCTECGAQQQLVTCKKSAEYFPCPADM
jgi:hypothetical protein